MAVNSEARSEVNSQVVVDWCVCCGCEVVAPQFVKSGIDSIKDLRDLEEDQFRKIVHVWSTTSYVCCRTGPVLWRSCLRKYQ